MNRSYLDVVTQNEDHELMAKMYPFWLGYRYRNADKEGLNPVAEIKKAITRDREYYNSLPENSRKKQTYSIYNFEKLDPEKISKLFKAKRAITPYEFAGLDFEDKSLVYKGRYVSDSGR